jgi:GT2 family glycosyltransferase
MAELVDVPAPRRPSASVVVCVYTLERWQLLVAAVRAAAAQCGPDDRLVVVVDHNDELLAKVQQTLGDVASVTENRYRRGLSGARNSGVESGTGDVVVFLDDDAVPADEWLTTLLGPFSDPAVWAAGGTARPAWSRARPGWFPEEFDWVVGCSYRGQVPERQAREATVAVRNPLGCNMAFRREVFEAVGGFREGVGRVGRHPLGCEETELCIRLRQARPEARILLVPDAVVDHHVPAERHRFSYFRRRCFAEGISKATVTGEVGTADGLSSERTYVTRTLPRGIVRGGPRRAGAILAGLAFTTGGYLRGRVKGGPGAAAGQATAPARLDEPAREVTPRAGR